MLVDANILLFAADRGSPFHARAAAWLTERLNGAVRDRLSVSGLAGARSE